MLPFLLGLRLVWMFSGMFVEFVLCLRFCGVLLRWVVVYVLGLLVVVCVWYLFGFGFCCLVFCGFS